MSVSRRLEQGRMKPQSISRWRMPPPWVIVTVPESFRLLHVPHTPLAQENGIATPAALAARRMVDPGGHVKVLPVSAKRIWRGFASMGASEA
jgi:hypothetical protein